MIIYDELIRRVENGEQFSINFEKRSLKVGKDWLIKDGETAEGNIICSFRPVAPMMETIEHLYKKYKYSMPSERSDSKWRTYFKALPAEELTDEQMVYGENREVAKARLEGFILCMILKGELKWVDDWGSWFFQSSADKDLVILRSWIEGK